MYIMRVVLDLGYNIMFYDLLMMFVDFLNIFLYLVLINQTEGWTIPACASFIQGQYRRDYCIICNLYLYVLFCSNWFSCNLY